MSKTTSSQSGQTEATTPSKRIKNTFVPNCNNEYFTPATLFGICKYGFPFDELPEEGKKMVIEYAREYRKRCTRTEDEIKYPTAPLGPGAIT